MLLKMLWKQPFKLLFLLPSLIFVFSCSQSDTPLQQYEHAVEGAFAAEISQNGNYSIVSSIHHGLSLWDNRNNKLLYQWKHRNAKNNDVYIVRISADNSYALSASRHEFAIWDIKTGQSIGFYKVSDSPIRDIRLSANGRYALYGQVNGKVVHIDLQSGRRLEMPIHSQKVNSVDLSANGLYALSGGNDHRAFLWNTKTAQIIQQFNFKHRVSMVKLEHDGRFAFIADNQKSSQIWNIETGELQSTLIYTARQSIFSSVRFINDGKQLLTGNGTKIVNLWDVNSGLSLQKWTVTPRKETRPKTAVVYSATLWDGENIATESSAGFLEIWPIEKLGTK
jgi:WD40 repeat protein